MTCIDCGAPERYQPGLDWDWFARQFPATRERLLAQQAAECCWRCGAPVGQDGRALPVIEPPPGSVVELDSQDEARTFVLTDTPHRVEHRCDCGRVEVVIDHDVQTHGTIRWLHSECRECQRARALALYGSPDCPICAEPTTFKPDHMGSPFCKSGSLASGGTRAHCSCDLCF